MSLETTALKKYDSYNRKMFFIDVKAFFSVIRKEKR